MIEKLDRDEMVDHVVEMVAPGDDVVVIICRVDTKLKTVKIEVTGNSDCPVEVIERAMLEATRAMLEASKHTMRKKFGNNNAGFFHRFKDTILALRGKL